MKKFLLKSILFSIIFCSFCAATYFLIKARTSTNPNLWDDGTSLYTNSNETLTAAKRNALVDRTMSCPSGFTLLANQGNVMWCLETNLESATTFASAMSNCYTTYWWRVANFNELYLGFSVFSLAWASSVLRIWEMYVESTNRWPMTYTHSPSSFSFGLLNSGSYQYRCFVSR